MPTVQEGERLAGAAVIHISDDERQREVSTSEVVRISSYLQPSTFAYHYKVGDAIETAAQQAYGQAFAGGVQVVRRTRDLPSDLPVIQPMVTAFRADVRHLDLTRIAETIHMELTVTVSLNGVRIWSGSAVSDVESVGLQGSWQAVNEAFRRSAASVMTDAGLQRKLAESARRPAVPKAVATTAAPPPSFPPFALSLNFPPRPQRPDDVAVIIGNADYHTLGRDIPDVRPAYADAEGMRRYAIGALGIREGNVIVLRDATAAHLARVFGTRDMPNGQLHDWIKPGRSRVFVYFSGHGAPATEGGSPFLVPVDADPARIEINGYPLKLLYDNLGRLPADSVTVVLEACFSGLSQGGSVVGQASPVYFEVKAPPVPSNLTVITAGAANQIASWEQDGSNGLFTKHFLMGMAGKADANHDGTVTLDELDRHLRDTMTYYARRYYGRDQQAQIVKGGGR
ncbi:MAG: caspase family protein [Magnetospirillum sp.]|nr:MAG: caspase family protein [Magnetospirillum sp.]